MSAANRSTTTAHRRPRQGGRPTRAQAEQRLRRLLDIARRHFLAAGYRGTSLDDVAREAGVSKKTLYHHFGSKSGLFIGTIEALRQSWIAELRGIVLKPAPPHVVLEAVALHTLDIGTRPEKIALQRLMMSEAHRFPESLRRDYRRAVPRGMEPLDEYLREAVAQGVLALEDVPLAAEQFTHLVLGSVRTRLLLGVGRRPGAAERRRIARQAVHIFLAGCLRAS